jgi:protein-tyrosine phosphatase
MVCLGNICRSPMAEGILRHKSEKYGISLHVDSCGTSGFHVGEGPDERAVRVMANYGIDISNLKARQFSTSDFVEFDQIFAMDSNNLSDILAQVRNPEQSTRVKLITEELYPGQALPVPDPYYGSLRDFERVYELLDANCERFLERLVR